MGPFWTHFYNGGHEVGLFMPSQVQVHFGSNCCTIRNVQNGFQLPNSRLLAWEFEEAKVLGHFREVPLDMPDVLRGLPGVLWVPNRKFSLTFKKPQ